MSFHNLFSAPVSLVLSAARGSHGAALVCCGTTDARASSPVRAGGASAAAARTRQGGCQKKSRSTANPSLFFRVDRYFVKRVKVAGTRSQLAEACHAPNCFSSLLLSASAHAELRDFFRIESRHSLGAVGGP